MTKILIVEDDAIISEMYANKFKEAGFDVYLAKDGQEALDKSLEIKPNLVLLDVVLPKMDGFEVLKKIKEDPKLKNDVKVILLTNLGEQKDIDKGLAMGAETYLIKAHYTPGKVVEKIKEILEKTSEILEKPEFKF